MSHHRNVGVLAHHQAIGLRAATHVPPDVADLLVSRLVAERISRKLIRMMPPASVFSATKACPAISNYIPARLSSGEIGGCKFIGPVSANTSTVPRTRYLPRRREIYGEWQLTVSLLPASGEAF